MWLALVAVIIWMIAATPIRSSRRRSICHTCGRHHLHEIWYAHDFRIWSRDQVIDPEGCGHDYDKLIGAPHQHDWHLAGIVSKNGGCGTGDGNVNVPFFALEFVRRLPAEHRSAVLSKIVKNAKTEQDVWRNFEAEIAALRSQGLIPQ